MRCSCWSWWVPSFFGSVTVLKKPEDERHFRDIAEEAGLTFTNIIIPLEQGEIYKVNLYDHGCGLAIANFDGDGYDDIYFVNQLGENHLYRNKGDGTFEDVTAKAGVAVGDRICTAATFADYDNDGRPDLFITSIRGGNILFHNEGNGTFRDVTKEANLTHIGHSQSAFFFDYDNDGKLDLLLIQTGSWTLNELNAQYRYFPGKEPLAEVASSPLARSTTHSLSTQQWRRNVYGRDRKIWIEGAGVGC